MHETAPTILPYRVISWLSFPLQEQSTSIIIGDQNRKAWRCKVVIGLRGISDLCLWLLFL